MSGAFALKEEVLKKSIGESSLKKITKQDDMFSLAAVEFSLSFFMTFESFILTFKNRRRK